MQQEPNSKHKINTKI